MFIAEHQSVHSVSIVFVMTTQEHEHSFLAGSLVWEVYP